MKFDLSAIQAQFRDLVGWREDSFDSSLPALTSPYDVVSRSGLYYNNAHPIVTLENIYYSILDDSMSDANFNTWLQNFTNEVIFETLRKLQQAKQLSKQSKKLLEQGKQFRQAGNLADKQINESKFVGWIIQLSGYENVRLTLHQLGVQFSKPLSNMRFYMFHTSKQDALWTHDVTTSTGLTFEWSAMTDKFIQYSDVHDNGGFFVLGYFQDDLVNNQANAQAINKTNYYYDGNCYSCQQNYDLNRYKQSKSFFKFTPFELKSDYLNGVNLPDFGNEFAHIEVEQNKTYGLNFDVSVESDITNFILRHEDLFIEPLRKMAAYKLLYYFIDTKRVNKVAETVKAQANLEIYRNQESSHILKDMTDQLKALDFDFSDLNSPSMPKSRPRIRYTSM